jgi:hypothetical protein
MAQRLKSVYKNFRLSVTLLTFKNIWSNFLILHILTAEAARAQNIV